METLSVNKTTLNHIPNVVNNLLLEMLWFTKWVKFDLGQSQFSMGINANFMTSNSNFQKQTFQWYQMYIDSVTIKTQMVRYRNDRKTWNDISPSIKSSEILRIEKITNL